MKFTPSAVLQALRAIYEKNTQGVFYGSDHIATEFVPCKITEEQLGLADHFYLLKQRSILRAALLTEQTQSFDNRNCHSYVDGAVCVRFSLANLQSGGLGLMVDDKELEVELEPAELNALYLCCADENGSGLLNV